jgi:hypothetical protein
VPFVLAGLYVIVGRFFVDAWRRGQTEYGVTSERVIIVRGGFSSSLTSLDAPTLTDITLDAKQNGNGTITFGPTSFTSSLYVGTP